MSLLSPLFLLGLLGIALPIWLHRLQTETQERESFSSSMLLERSEQRIHLQKQLRYLLLLALRILIVTLLVLAFSKPFWEFLPASVTQSEDQAHLILIDTSFSMTGNARMDVALTQAREIIDSISDDELAQIIIASGEIAFISELSSDKNILHASLNTVAPGLKRLDYGKMMTAISGVLDDYRQNILIHFISDFQSSGLPSRFADLIPESTSGYALNLVLHPVSEEEIANLSVEHINHEKETVYVTVRNSLDTHVENTLSLMVNETDAQSKPVQISGKGVEIVEINNLVLEQGDNALLFSLEQNDALSGDDQRYFVIDNKDPAPVLLISDSPGSRAANYLTTALETDNYAVERVDIGDLDPRILSRYPWVIIEDLGIVNQSLEQILLDYIHNGNSVLAAVGEQSVSLDRLPVTAHSITHSSITRKESQFASVSRIDSSHPLLHNTTGWRSINISRTVNLEAQEEDRILINLENNNPLLLEQAMGRGRMILLTTSLDNTWSDLPVHPVFVSFITETATYLANENTLDRQYSVGDSLLLQQSGGGAGQIIDPGGNTVLSLEDTMRGRDIMFEETGFYTLVTSDGEMKMAVNVAPRESITGSIAEDIMNRWQNTSGIAQTIESDTYTNTVEPVRWEFWHTLLVILALVVFLESLLGDHYLSFRTGV